jgi:hypothetical protein
VRLRDASLAVACAGLLAAPSALAAAPVLSVDAASGRHPISPLIYGWNFADPAFAAEIDLPVDRRGGNRADTLNWQTGFENTSLDYFFEDLPWCWGSSPCDAMTDPAHAYTDQIDSDQALGAKTILDVPLLGFVAGGAGHFDHPFVCSYTTGNVDPYQTDCGDNMNVDRTAFLSNDDKSGVSGVAATPAFQADWVDDLVTRYDSAANGGVAFYELGNEPGLWDSTHHDWHPSPTGALELMDKSEAMAAAIKAADPSAKTIGPAEWGWPHYFCSAADGGCGPDDAGGADRLAYGPMMEAYLARFKDHADNNAGERLLDYLDVHYYAQGGSTTDITRSLWDPTYTDPSWISDRIELIPRMHRWVDDNYPGTKISLSEYDLANGGDASTNNIIQADVLGIFAREGLDMATLWPEVGNSNYLDAFRVYRNYDGSGSKFGDTYVSSTSSDQSAVAVYGALRSSDGALTIVAVNKGGEDPGHVAYSGFTPGGPAQVWRWSGAGGGIARQADASSCDGGVSTSLPSGSITGIVIPAGTGNCAVPITSPGGTTLPPSGSPPPTGSTTPPPATTSTRPVRCKVPKLRGLTLKKAKRKLRKAHCRLGKVRKARSRVKRGRVIAQKPRPRKVLRRGAKVGVTLSRGR